MATIEQLIEKMRNNPVDVRFSDLQKVSEHFFGKPRMKGSHMFFKKPWKGYPPVLLQETKGMAKPYQVRQVLEAIKKLEEGKDV